MKILAIEDGGFDFVEPSKRKRRALLVGVITSDFRIEKLVISSVQVDGLDATSRVIGIAKKERIPLDLIMLGSISIAGFNLIDILEVYATLKIPLIVANSKEPKEGAIEGALRHHFSDWQERLRIIEKMKKPRKLVLSETESTYLQVAGVSLIRARKLIKELTVFGKQPEPLRVAHILAHELSRRGPEVACKK